MIKTLLDFVLQSVCEICGIQGEAICASCRQLIPTSQLDGPVVVFGHNPEIVRLLIGWKDHQRRELTPLLADCVVRALPKDVLAGRRVIPIPSRKQSYKKRGWNPTRDLAIEIARTAEMKFSDQELTYRSEPTEQRGLDFSSRADNLLDKFQFNGPDAHVLLVDDVFTSGATLWNAQRAIKTNFLSGTDSPKIVALAAARRDFQSFLKKFLENQ